MPHTPTPVNLTVDLYGLTGAPAPGQAVTVELTRNDQLDGQDHGVVIVSSQTANTNASGRASFQLLPTTALEDRASYRISYPGVDTPIPFSISADSTWSALLDSLPNDIAPDEVGRLLPDPVGLADGTIAAVSAGLWVAADASGIGSGTGSGGPAVWHVGDNPPASPVTGQGWLFTGGSNPSGRIYDGSSWEPVFTIGEMAVGADELGVNAVDLQALTAAVQARLLPASPTDGQIAHWVAANSAWEATDPPTGGTGGGATTLGALTDVSTAGASANEVLTRQSDGSHAFESVTAHFPLATHDTPGSVELATQAEVTAGTDASRVVNVLELRRELEGTNLDRFQDVPTRGNAGQVLQVNAAEDALEWATVTATGSVPNATESERGIIEIATDSEVQSGTDNEKAVTPQGLARRTATLGRAGLVELASDAETQAGTDPGRVVSPLRLRNELEATNLSRFADVPARGTAGQVLAATATGHEYVDQATGGSGDGDGRSETIIGPALDFAVNDSLAYEYTFTTSPFEYDTIFFVLTPRAGTAGGDATTAELPVSRLEALTAQPAPSPNTDIRTIASRASLTFGRAEAVGSLNVVMVRTADPLVWWVGTPGANSGRGEYDIVACVGVIYGGGVGAPGRDGEGGFTTVEVGAVNINITSDMALYATGMTGWHEGQWLMMDWHLPVSGGGEVGNDWVWLFVPQLTALDAATAGTVSSWDQVDHLTFAAQRYGAGNREEYFIRVARTSANELLVGASSVTADPMPLTVRRITESDNTFLALMDTPTSFVANQHVAVNADGTALVLVDPPEAGASALGDLSNVTTGGAQTGNVLKWISGQAAAFRDNDFADLQDIAALNPGNGDLFYWVSGNPGLLDISGHNPGEVLQVVELGGGTRVPDWRPLTSSTMQRTNEWQQVFSEGDGLPIPYRAADQGWMTDRALIALDTYIDWEACTWVRFDLETSSRVSYPETPYRPVIVPVDSLWEIRSGWSGTPPVANYNSNRTLCFWQRNAEDRGAWSIGNGDQVQGNGIGMQFHATGTTAFPTSLTHFSFTIAFAHSPWSRGRLRGIYIS